MSSSSLVLQLPSYDSEVTTVEKIFKRQSGQMKAVQKEVEGLLEATREILTKIKSDAPPEVRDSIHPPPLPPIRNRFESEEIGRYSLLEPEVVKMLRSPPPLPREEPAEKPKARPRGVVPRPEKKKI